MTRIARYFPTLLLLLSGVALGWLVLPFLGSILWGAILAMLCMPAYRSLLPRVCQHRNLAAAIVLLLVLTIVVLPLGWVGMALATETSALFGLIDSGAWRPADSLHLLFDSLPAWMRALLDYFGMGSFAAVMQQLTLALSQLSRLVASQSLSIGLNTFEFAVRLAIALYLAFFLLRDGEALAQSVWNALPLAHRQKQELRTKFSSVVHATIKGSLLIALLQGTLGGLAFWYLDVRAPVLWATLMAFASLLPPAGTSLVWLPVALYLVLVGLFWKALLLTLYGVMVVGLVDNLVRPALVGREAGLPDYVVMISTLGGLAVLGMHGVVVGPVLAALFLAVWHMCSANRPSD